MCGPRKERAFLEASGCLSTVRAATARGQTMADAPQTAEQNIRGGDGAADWVLLVGGYDLEAIKDTSSLVAGGIVGLYRPAYSLSSGEIA